MSSKPAVEQDKITNHYLRRIARLEQALRDIRQMGNALAPPHDYGYRARQIANDALFDSEEVGDG
jgi:hypothetical protein